MKLKKPNSALEITLNGARLPFESETCLFCVPIRVHIEQKIGTMMEFFVYLHRHIIFIYYVYIYILYTVQVFLMCCNANSTVIILRAHTCTTMFTVPVHTQCRGLQGTIIKIGSNTVRVLQTANLDMHSSSTPMKFWVHTQNCAQVRTFLNYAQYVRV